MTRSRQASAVASDKNRERDSLSSESINGDQEEECRQVADYASDQMLVSHRPSGRYAGLNKPSALSKRITERSLFNLEVAPERESVSSPNFPLPSFDFHPTIQHITSVTKGLVSNFSKHERGSDVQYTATA